MNEANYESVENKNMYFVLRDFGYGSMSVAEKFDSGVDAETYAALMCRTKKAKYIVLSVVNTWDGTEQPEQ